MWTGWKGPLGYKTNHLTYHEMNTKAQHNGRLFLLHAWEVASRVVGKLRDWHNFVMLQGLRFYAEVVIGPRE